MQWKKQANGFSEEKKITTVQCAVLFNEIFVLYNHETFSLFYQLCFFPPIHRIFLLYIIIPIKIEDFFNAEISIFSCVGFFIYLFEDFLRRTVSVDFSQDVRRFSTKHIKCRYFHEINEKSRTGINGYFCIETPYYRNGISNKMENFLMQKYPFIPARDFSFIWCSKIFYKTNKMQVFANEKSRAGIMDISTLKFFYYVNGICLKMDQLFIKTNLVLC